MTGNSIGQAFVVTTAGESHGPALVAIVDGCPPGMLLSEQDIQVDLERRRSGLSRFTSARLEPDQVEILSGVFEGKTTGTPIAMLIRNKDAKPRDYAAIKDQYRPGHADFTYHKKYGIRDYRGGGRASARETVMRVAAGAIARKYLSEQCGVKITGYCQAIGEITAQQFDAQVINSNPFFFPDQDQLPRLETYLQEIRRQGDSVGARVAVSASGVPIGLGEPVFSRLDADIACAMMSINAVKAVEIGDGTACVTTRGIAYRDAIDSQQGFLSNHAGGILGGISSGQDIFAQVSFKPTSSLTTPVDSINQSGEDVSVVTTGRHDPCVGIRAVPIVEAMLALVLMDHAMRHKAQNL